MITFTHPSIPNPQVLALNQLTEHADAVLPIDNARLSVLSSKGASGSGSNAVKKTKGKGGFDEMNNVVARLLTDLTAR